MPVDEHVKSEFLAGVKSKDEKYRNKLSRRIDKCVAIFDSLGITEPQAADYARLEAELRPMTQKVIRDHVNTAKGYYHHLYLKKAGREQMTIAPDLEPEQEIVEHAAVSVMRPLTATVADSAQALDLDDKPASPTVDAVDTQVNEVSKPKRGRKAKPENADRVQVSVYLPRETYEGVRDLAANSGQGISDILARLAFFFIKNNAGVLERIREAKRLSITYEL